MVTVIVSEAAIVVLISGQGLNQPSDPKLIFTGHAMVIPGAKI